MKPFNPENVALVENKSGNYFFYDKARRFIYVGVSTILKHRIQSYYQKDDFSVHRTKRELRRHIRFFSVKYRPIREARAVEKRLKQKARFNYQK